MSQVNASPSPLLSQPYQAIKRIDRVYLVVFAIFAAIALMDTPQLLPLARLTLSNLLHTSMYMVFAVLVLAYIKATGSEAMVASIFKGRENRMIFLAAMVGGLAPFCSCEVIPFIAGLLALGTPLAPIMAFWLSSPLIDPPTLLITAGALGWQFAVSKAVIAVAIGLFGGYGVKLIQTLGHFDATGSALTKGSSQSCCSTTSCCDSGVGESVEKPLWLFWKEKERRSRFSDEFKANGLFLLKWMMLAYSLESLMIHYVPADMIASVVGGEGIVPIILSALVGVPAYLNSYIAPPVVSGLMEQGMSAGSGMAFIVAGAVSSIPAMTAVYAVVRKRVFAAYVLFGFTGAVLSGFIYSLIG